MGRSGLREHGVIRSSEAICDDRGSAAIGDKDLKTAVEQRAVVYRCSIPDNKFAVESQISG